MIQLERKQVETQDGVKECSTVVRVGVVQENENNYWTLRVSYSPLAEPVYESRCVPTEREVHVRPATTIDLIYNTPAVVSSLVSPDLSS